MYTVTKKENPNTTVSKTAMMYQHCGRACVRERETLIIKLPNIINMEKGVINCQNTHPNMPTSISSFLLCATKNPICFMSLFEFPIFGSG